MYVKIDSLFSSVLWVLAIMAIYFASRQDAESSPNVSRAQAAVVETIDAVE